MKSLIPGIFLSIILSYQVSGKSVKESFNVMNFGAAGNGSRLDTKAIQKAIDSCAVTGGTVSFPAGKYLTGTIYLKDNITLEIMNGAVILGSTDLADYPENDPDIIFYGSEWLDYSLFYAEKKKNITIKGEGTIDGQGSKFPVINEKKPFRYMNRPYIFWFILCENINIEGIHLQNSALWMQHYLACTGIVIKGISVYNHSNRNNDMIDIDGCRNVIISDCFGDSDDDAITFKSTSDHITENVTVTNCILSSHCNALKFGTESNGGFRNVTISNCIIKPSSSPTKIYGDFKGSGGLALEIVDGGIMDGILINNLRIDGPLVPIFIRLGDRGRPYGPDTTDIPPGQLKNVIISNIIATASGKEGCSITGIPGARIENVRLSNIRIYYPGNGISQTSAAEVPELIDEYPEGIMFGMLPSYGLYIRHVRNISLGDIFFTYENEEDRPPLLADDVQGLRLIGMIAQTGVGTNECIHLINCSHVEIGNSSTTSLVPLFVRISGTKSEHIEILPGSKVNAIKKYKIADGANSKAVISKVHFY